MAGGRATKVDFECPRSREADEKPLQSEKFFKFDPSEVEPWKGIMVRNSPGHAPAGAPVFIAQGTADTTVNSQITKRFGEALCAQGVRVSFVELPGVSLFSPHATVRPPPSGG